jgi:hypothetical protein
VQLGRFIILATTKPMVVIALGRTQHTRRCSFGTDVINCV